MMGKISHEAQLSHGEDTCWETRKIQVPICILCDKEIRGNGSVVLPYQCECSLFVWDGTAYNKRLQKPH